MSVHIIVVTLDIKFGGLCASCNFGFGCFTTLLGEDCSNGKFPKLHGGFNTKQTLATLNEA